MRLPAGLVALGALLLLPACAHGQGAALLQKPITAGNCPTLGSPNLVADSGVGCSGHQVTISDGVHGSMLFAPTTPLLPNSPAILNNTSAQPLLFIKGVASTGADGVDFDYRRIASYTGGTFGFVNATLRTFTTVSAGTKSFEWPMLCVLDNSAALADNTQNSCGYFQAHKRNGGGTWALTAELQDHNADPVSPSVTFEHDLQVKGTDVHAARVIDDLWGKTDDGNAAVIANAFRLNTDAHTTFTNGITTQGATISNAAFAMGSGQKFCVDGLTCTYTLSQGSGVLSYTGALAVTGQIVTTGNIAIGTGNKLCLDGIACTSTVSQTGGAISLTAPSGVLTGALLASSVAVTGNVDILSGQKLCLDGTTCANTISQSGGTITATATAATLPATTAPSLTSTGPVVVSTNQKVCLNGSSCTIYILYDGVAIGFYNSGAAKFQMNMSTGTAGAAAALTSGVSTGVNCSGSPTGSHQTVGGLTTVC